MSLKPPACGSSSAAASTACTGATAFPAGRPGPTSSFYGRAGAEQFVGTAGLLGLDTARRVLAAEENGLVIPTARFESGSRFPSEDEVACLEVIERMEPLGFSREGMTEQLPPARRPGLRHR